MTDLESYLDSGNRAEVSDMKNAVLRSVETTTVDDNDALLFTAEDGRKWLMTHYQSCCESVSLEDTNGDFEDLLGTPLLIAEGVSSRVPPPEIPLDRGTYDPDSETWTFYKFATIKGHVTLRWYGISNGYYSESVDFYRAGGPHEKL